MSPEELLIKLIHTHKVARVEAYISLEEGTAIPVLYGEIQHTQGGPTHKHKFKYRDGRWQRMLYRP